MTLAVHLLGPPRVECGAQLLAPPRGHKAWALLAVLACGDRDGSAVASRSHLAQLLFEDAEDPLAALRWNLSELRRLIGRDTLRGETPRLPHERLQIDVVLLAEGSWAEALRLPGLGRELLEGMHFPGSPAFGIWLAARRRHLQASTEAVLREAALARLAAGCASEAADLAGRLVQHDPLDENHQALLVRSLAADGDGVGAARQAAACRALFQRELGVAPGAVLDAALRTLTAAPVARPATGRAAALAQLDAGAAAIGAGALEPGLQCLRRAIAEADACNDPVLRARTRVGLGGALVHAARGRDEEGASALHEALAVGRDQAPLQAAAACRELGYVEFLRGRYDRALRWLRQAAPLAGDDAAERARIATVHGAALSDTAHYAAALARLDEAVQLAERVGDVRQLAYALSMSGRVHLLRSDAPAAADRLDRSLALARQTWTAFLPWPQALRAELDLQQGELDAAAAGFEHAFALGCQLGDPCWEGLAARGLGLVAIARGQPQRAAALLVDAIARSARLPDAYLWGKALALETLCALAVRERLPQAAARVGELQALAERCGMRELSLRAQWHAAALGDRDSARAAAWLAGQIDNPALAALALPAAG